MKRLSTLFSSFTVIKYVILLRPVSTSALIAQSVEHTTVNRKVGRSKLPWSVSFFTFFSFFTMNDKKCQVVLTVLYPHCL